MDIKKLIARNEKLNYLQRVLRHCNNPQYRSAVLNLGDENEYRIESYGPLNKGKIIYVYKEDHSYESGFFATYRRMIEVCNQCEVYGFIPVITFGEHYPYSEWGKTINGQSNPYNHFFRNVSTVTYEDAMHSFAVIMSSGTQWMAARKMMLGHSVDNEELGYAYDEIYFQNAANILKKHIRWNDLLIKEVKSDIRALLGTKRTLGVHVRIKVFQQQINRHPIVSDIGEYIAAARDALNNGFEQIYLATDELGSLHTFRSEFGEKVLYYGDAFRSDEGNTLLDVNVSSRENHRYLLGYEVIRDMLTLADCDGLVCGLSQVSFCAQITKLSYDSEYRYLKVFDHGVHHSKFTTKDSYKKRMKNNRSK